MFCSVCYYSIESDETSFHCMCNDKTCHTNTCVDCFEAYVNHLESENLNVVKCPSSSCNFEFSYSHITNSENKNIIKTFEKICFKRIESDYKNEAIVEIFIHFR